MLFKGRKWISDESDGAVPQHGPVQRPTETNSGPSLHCVDQEIVRFCFFILFVIFLFF